MRYEIIIPSPFDGEKILLSLPLDIVGVSRADGEQFINVNGFNACFDKKGVPYEPIPRNMEN
jgi:hypothetical protein